MNDAALSKPGAYSHVRVREPAGERTLGTAVSVGGDSGEERADIIVPGAASGIVLTIERQSADWIAAPAPGAAVRFDGRPLTKPRELHKDDVLSVGAAQ